MRRLSAHAPRPPPGPAGAAVAVLLALVAVLVPVDAPHTPQFVGGVFGGSAAAAQTSAGTPTDCADISQVSLDWPDPHDDNVMNQGVSAEWQPQNSDPDDATSDVCVLEIPPCPPVPWAADPAVFLQPATEMPDFCEIVIAADDPLIGHLHGDCAASTGSATAHVVDDGIICTARMPMRCPVGLRIAHDSCRVIHRRDWACAAPLVRGNGFNTCFEEGPPAGNPALHPACGVGAPSLGSISCAEYVGTDYLDNPAGQRCDNHPSYLTGLVPASLQPATSDYWCGYDARLLDARCHSDPNGQPYQDGECGQTQMANCLKRSGDAGGCNGIAHSIRCAVLVAPHVSGFQDADDPAVLRAQGCTPCIVLPFSPSLTNCPDDVAEDPELGTVSRSNSCGPTEEEVLRARRSLDHDHSAARTSCRSTADVSHDVCPDPGKPSLSWASNHIAARAVINSPVTIRVDHVPVQAVRIFFIQPKNSPGDNALDRFAWPANPLGRHGLEVRGRAYGNYASDTEFVNILSSPQLDGSVSGLHDLVDHFCILDGFPAFIIEIEELWPDLDRAEIEEHFGVDLQWWADLPDQEQERLTSLRGLQWTGSMSAAEQLLEIERRERELSVLADCNSTPRAYASPHDEQPDSLQQKQVWCRWIPERSGWFKATALGAWQMQANERPSWKSEAEIDNMVAWLNDRGGRPFDAYLLPFATSDTTQAESDSLGSTHDDLPAVAWCQWLYDSVSGTCTGTLADYSYFQMGYRPAPADFGLKADPDGTFTRPLAAMDRPDSESPGRDDELYRFADGAYRAVLSRRSRHCPSLDIRIECGSNATIGIGKFTPSDPVYIAVHEIRTRKVSTSP